MMQNYEKEEKIFLNPVGLVNLSRYQRINNYKSYKKSNLLNSCYMNASIQCLFRIDEFVKNIIKYESNTAYGVLFEGYGICSGYADVMGIFLNRYNITK